MFFSGLRKGDIPTKTMAGSVVILKRRTVYKREVMPIQNASSQRVSLSKKRIAVLFHCKCLWISDSGELFWNQGHLLFWKTWLANAFRKIKSFLGFCVSRVINDIDIFRFVSLTSDINWRLENTVPASMAMRRRREASWPAVPLRSLTLAGSPHPLPQILQKSILSHVRAEKIRSIFISIYYKRPLLCRRQPSLQKPRCGRLSPNTPAPRGTALGRRGCGAGLGWRACGGIAGRPGTLAALWRRGGGSEPAPALPDSSWKRTSERLRMRASFLELNGHRSHASSPLTCWSDWSCSRRLSGSAVTGIAETGATRHRDYRRSLTELSSPKYQTVPTRLRSEVLCVIMTDAQGQDGFPFILLPCNWFLSDLLWNSLSFINRCSLRLSTVWNQHSYLPNLCFPQQNMLVSFRPV